MVNLGSYGYVANELLIVTDPSLTRETVQQIAAQYGFSVAGVVEAADTLQLRASQNYSAEELEGFAALIAEEQGVLFAGLNYLTSGSVQTVADTQTVPPEAGAVPENRASDAIRISFYPEAEPTRLGVLSTMFDAAHESIRFGQLPDNDIYFETDKDSDEASEGTFVAGVTAGKKTEAFEGGIYAGSEVIGVSLGSPERLHSSVETLSSLWTVLSYGMKVVTVDIGYSKEFIGLLTAQDPAALAAYMGEREFVAKALSGFLSRGIDMLLVCPAGDGETDTIYNSALCGINDTSLRQHILVVGAAAVGEGDVYSLSRYSANTSRIDVFAPGESIYGPVSRNAYGYRSGTGAAAAVASGACAFLACLRPESGCDVIRDAVCKSADIPVSGAMADMIDMENALRQFGVHIYENHVEAPEQVFISVEDGISFVSNEVVLIIDTFFTKQTGIEIAKQYGFSVVGYVEAANTLQLRSSTARSLMEITELCARIMRENPDTVWYAGINYLRNVEEQTLPNDPWDGSPADMSSPDGGNWGVEAINATWVWDTQQLPQITVGVIDSMFDGDHEDLVYERLLYNTIYSGADKSEDKASHGTHVSGTIGAIHNNRKGVAGVFPSAKIYGASLFGAPSFLNEVSLLSQMVTDGVKIINFSMGSSVEDQIACNNGDPTALSVFDAETTACTHALYNLLYNNFDFLVVTVAGNAGREGCDARFINNFAAVTDPRVRDHILVVGAAELTGNGTYALAPFSEQGERVDVIAPGVGIMSCTAESSYGFMDGTSMAAPHAAGACGVLQALRPDLDCVAIKNLIVRNADISVSGTNRRMIDLKAAVLDDAQLGDLEPETDPFYDGKGTRPSYKYNSNDGGRFFLFLSAENAGLDSGSTRYYVHDIDEVITVKELFRRGISQNAYIAIMPVDSNADPMRTDVIRILEYEDYGSRAYKIKYQVLMSGSIVYDRVSEIREAVLSPNAWVWMLKERDYDFGTDTLNFDENGDYIFEREVKVVDLRDYLNENGKGSVRFVGDFVASNRTADRSGLRSWADPDPQIMTELERFMGKTGASAHDVWISLGN